LQQLVAFLELLRLPESRAGQGFDLDLDPASPQPLDRLRCRKRDLGRLIG
jgi:hypothetical protein